MLAILLPFPKLPTPSSWIWIQPRARHSRRIRRISALGRFQGQQREGHASLVVRARLQGPRGTPLGFGAIAWTGYLFLGGGWEPVQMAIVLVCPGDDLFLKFDRKIAVLWCWDLEFYEIFQQWQQGSCFKCTLEGRSLAVHFSDLCLHVDMSNHKHYKSTHAITIKRFLMMHLSLFFLVTSWLRIKPWILLTLEELIYHLYTWFARPSIQFFLCLYAYLAFLAPATWLKDFSNGCGWQIIWQLRINVGPQRPRDSANAKHNCQRMIEAIEAHHI